MFVPLRNSTLALLSTIVLSSAALAQAKVAVPPPIQPVPGVEYRSGDSLQALAAQLVSAAAATGIAGAPLDKTPTHSTLLTVRTKSGGGELHRKSSDLFVVIDGEATILTGGTIIDPQTNGDEERGTRVEGGVPQVMHKGDVILIAPNTPHQAIVAPGKTFAYFVVKVPTQ